MGRHSVLGGLAVVAAAAGLLVGQMGVFATSAFTPGSTGYDISYPQCQTTYPSGAFGIVGVSKGYPFTYYNPCFASEWSYAQRSVNASLYINTGYDPSYTNSTDGRHTTADCVTRSAGHGTNGAQQAAWAVGCSEAERSVEYASCGDNVIPSTCATIATPAVWWLDVEFGNSWCGQSGTSCTDLSLNDYTIQGIVDTLHQISNNQVPVGVYSTSTQWTSIVGSSPIAFTGINADWQATAVRSAKTAKSYCKNSGFAGSAPIWLVQFLPGRYDADYAC